MMKSIYDMLILKSKLIFFQIMSPCSITRGHCIGLHDNSSPPLLEVSVCLLISCSVLSRPLGTYWSITWTGAVFTLWWFVHFREIFPSLLPSMYKMVHFNFIPYISLWSILVLIFWIVEEGCYFLFLLHLSKWNKSLSLFWDRNWRLFYFVFNFFSSILHRFLCWSVYTSLPSLNRSNGYTTRI